MKKIRVAACLAIAVACIVLTVALSRAGTRMAAESASVSKSASGYPVFLNEIMASNESYYNADGLNCDWIELCNSADYAIDLSGFLLTDNNRRVRYTFPDGAEIAANGYCVVWCEKNRSGDYADFAIAKAGGESLLLMNSRSVTVDSVVTWELARDEAMVRGASGEWERSTDATPGFANDAAGRAAYLESTGRHGFTVRIHEVMARNGGYPDPNGRMSDWVELYNEGPDDMPLGGFHLSDRQDRPGYVFPEGTRLTAGGYLVIYCDSEAPDESYAPFSISGAGGESLYLKNANDVVFDEAAVKPQRENESQIRLSDGGWTLTERPTPGFPNTDEGAQAYFVSVNPEGFDVRITEVMAKNTATVMDADGDFSDWIELANCGSTPVDLAGYGLSDRPEEPMRYRLPAIVLEPGGRVIVFASGKERYDAAEPHTGFSLDARTETIVLAAPQGRTVSVFSYTELEEDESAYLNEETGELGVTKRPTPRYPNTEDGYERFQNASVPAGPIVINEVSPRNGTLLEQDGTVFDWVELKNVSADPVRLSDYYLSDSLKQKQLYRLPETVLPANGLAVILCTGTDTAPVFRLAHCALSIGSDSDVLYLNDAAGHTVDFLRAQAVPYDASMGRLPEQGGAFYLAAASPGAENKRGFRAVSAMPEPDCAGGVFGQAQLRVSLFGEGAIYYTTDGSVPTEKSRRYAEPIELTGSAVIRSIAVGEGALPSEIRTDSYVLTDVHTLPVLSVSTEPDNLYHPSTGISAPQNRYSRTVERTAHVEFFSEQGSFSLDCGIKLHGASTRGRGVNQKRSFKLTFRPRYDAAAPLEFPLFPGSEVTTFYSVLLRNGEDYSRAFVRDEILPALAEEGSEALMTQDSRYCVLYINGHYEGIYCIKEAYSSGYYAEHYGVDKESVEMQRGYVTDETPLRGLMNYALSHDMRVAEYYDAVAAQINLDSLIDWCIVEAYSANRDIGVNIRYYRSTEEGNKWRYALLDLDFGLHRPATFEYVLHGTAHGNLPRCLLDNPGFRDRFLRRFAELTQGCLATERVLERYRALVGEVEGEMARERARWPQGEENVWSNYLAVLETQIQADRVAQMQKSLAAELRMPLAEVQAYFGVDA